MVRAPETAHAWSMTTTPPEAPSGPSAGSPDDGGPRVSRDEMRDLGRLRRSATDRKVAGVAGGLARHLDVDPLILRVAFVVLAFFGGAGLIVYGACWLLVPDEETGEAAVTLDDRSRTLALLVVGAIAAFALIGDSWGVFSFPWPLAIIAVVALVLLTRKDRPQAPPGTGGAPYLPVHDAPYAAPPAGGPAPATDHGPGTTTGAVPPVAPAEPGPQTTLYQPYSGYQAPYYQPGQRPEARNPRRRGPILFWFTLALIALAVGVLGMIDVAGVAVADSAYPALGVGIVGVMLLVGSVYGRAGGLVLLGLLGAVGLAGVTAAGSWDSDTVRVTPTTVADIEDSYDFGAGELRLDLTDLQDPQNLDDRTIRLDGGVGQIEVIVPDGVDVQVDATVDGPGNIRLFGQDRGGIGTEWDQRFVRGDVADLTIDAELGVGEIIVNEE